MLQGVEMLSGVVGLIEGKHQHVPKTMPADFYSGFINGYHEGLVDIREETNSCMVPDKDLADQFDDAVKEIEELNWRKAKRIISLLEPTFKEDFAPCKTDPQYASTVAAAEQNLQDTVKQWKDDPNSLYELRIRYFSKKSKLEKELARLENKYDQQDYYSAGKKLGKMFRQVADPWYIPFETNPSEQFLN